MNSAPLFVLSGLSAVDVVVDERQPRLFGDEDKRRLLERIGGEAKPASKLLDLHA